MTYNEIYEELKKKLRKDYGKKCSDFHYNCGTCQAYLMLQILEDCIDLESDWELPKPKKVRLINVKEFVKNAKKTGWADDK